MIYKVIRNLNVFFKKIIEDDIYALASQLAYNLILAFFPFLMFIMTLIGYSNLNSEVVLDLLRRVMPLAAYQLIESTVVAVINTQQSGLLWVSILLALWTSSSGFSAVIRGVNKAYGVKETRSFIVVKLISIFSVLILAIIILATLLLFVFSNTITGLIKEYIHNPELILDMWSVAKNIVLILLMVLSFMVMYQLIPCKRLGWLNVIPGAAFTTVGWIAASAAFAYYVNHFGNYSRFYGSLGAVFIFMTWIFLTSFILILGGEVNAILVE
ncbi:MAG: YihY/virulence factor BrkB family protein [Sarcina sp.]